MSSALTPIAVEPVPRVALTLEETAEALSISSRTLRNWIKAGDGPPVFRQGQIVRVPVSPLQQWIADRATAGAEGGG